MNLKKLKKVEAEFMLRYPGGFQNPEMIAIGKKHPIAKMTVFAHEAFAEEQFTYPDKIVAAMSTGISRSSMVSMFEKPKFRDFTKVMPTTDQEALAEAFYEQLHGNQAAGFEAMVEQLKPIKLAKWTLLTILPLYFRPNHEVFVKPMTTKGIINTLALDMQYKPLPSWDFYSAYRDLINEIKGKVDPSLSPNNAAFSGFLMMSA